jgi:hypothetical protein
MHRDSIEPRVPPAVTHMASRSHHDLGAHPTLADRIAAARHRRFVGRATELAMFARAVDLPDPPFAVLFVHGPGGIGKSALLAEYRRVAEVAGRRTVAIDGRACEPSPPGFLAAIARELGLADPAEVLDALAAMDDLVLVIDTCEALRPLDGWLRNELLPRLPATALTVIAGRHPPDVAWRASPGWADLVAVQALRNLAPDESRDYLASRNVPDAAHPSVLAFTHGHPLALSLVGDVVARSDAPFAPDRAPDVVAALLDHFIEHEPSPRHRLALEACAHARVTTESLLARMFGEEDAARLFRWLCELSFIEHGQGGVYPHDLARDVLAANLRWRHPERFRQVHQQVHDYHIDRVRSTQGREQFQELYNLMYLHRDNPSWQRFAQTDRYGHEYLEPATPEDCPAILEMIEHHEGPEPAGIAARWIAEQPEAFKVLRDVHGEITGMVTTLMLGRYRGEQVAFDPLAAAALALVARHAPLRPGGEALCVRWCIGRDTYRTEATRTHFAMTSAPIVYTHRHLEWGLFPVPDPAYWEPIFDYLCFQRFPDADTRFAGRGWAWFGTHFRTMPIEQLDRILTEREISLSPVLEHPARRADAATAMLSEAEFRQAVRQALRDYHRAAELAANPLAQSRLVAERAGGDPVASVRDLLREAVEATDTGPRARPLRDALHHTYIAPSRTQEAAAELLDLPFSTYRRHLRAGIDRVSAELWRRELAATGT